MCIVIGKLSLNKLEECTVVACGVTIPKSHLVAAATVMAQVVAAIANLDVIVTVGTLNQSPLIVCIHALCSCSNLADTITVFINTNNITICIERMDCYTILALHKIPRLPGPVGIIVTNSNLTIVVVISQHL